MDKSAIDIIHTESDPLTLLSDLSKQLLHNAIYNVDLKQGKNKIKTEIEALQK
jgi:hypothetical protein